MSHFERLDVNGIPFPIYFKKHTRDIRPVMLDWHLFVGSADDLSVGRPGLFHWFEHVPFRGTKSYPKGAMDIDSFLERNGGSVNAFTGKVSTAYEAYVPHRLWKKGFDIITDLVSAPLLREKDIEAERAIVIEEQVKTEASSMSYALEYIHKELWGDHPLAHSIGGSIKDIRGMTASMLRKAHSSGYSSSRMALIVSGAIDKRELLGAVDSAVARLPHPRMSDLLETDWRDRGAEYGPIPKWRPGKTVVPTKFPSTVVFVVFPVPKRSDDPDRAVRYWTLADMFGAGGLSSPMAQIIREERNLVYKVNTYSSKFADGGVFGFIAETSPRNESKLIRAFFDVIRSKQARSRARHAVVKDTIKADMEMQLPSPARDVGMAGSSLTANGRILSDAEWLKTVQKWPYERVMADMRRMTEEQARIIVFRGKS